jgi:exodeoxyribonuclease VIII
MTTTISAPVQTPTPAPIGEALLSPEAAWEAAWGHALTGAPQVFAGLPREAYDQLPGWNASLLKVIIEKTEAHAWSEFINPDREQEEDTGHLLVGNLAHCRVLEPELFDQRYLALPPDAPKRPTAKQLEGPKPRKDGTINKDIQTYADWQEAVQRENWWKSLEVAAAERGDGRKAAQIVGDKDLRLGDALAGAVLNHPVLAPRFADTPQNRAGNELTLTGIDPLTGARWKARLDAVRFLGDRLWIGDLKSAMDAGPGPDCFGRAAANFNYCLSGAWYRDAAQFCRAPLEELLGLPEGALITMPNGYEFEFIAVEKAHPRPEFVGRYVLTDEQAQLGRGMARRALERAVQAEASGCWLGYDSAAQPLQLPGHAYQKMQRLAGVEA